MVSPASLQYRSSLYRQYKLATSKLVCFIINTSNEILDRLIAAGDRGGHLLPALNTSGTLRVAEITPLARLIAEHHAVPPTALALLGDIIRLRTKTADEFDHDLAQRPEDENLRKGNARHRHFIDVLRAAFEAFGGDLNDLSVPILGEHSATVAEMDDILFRNFFAALDMDDDEEVKVEETGAVEVAAIPTQPQRRQQRKGGKGKKRPYKASKGPPVEVKRQRIKPLDIPVEAYRIIQDGEGLITDYLLTTYDLMQEVSNLRLHLQEEWWEVAYHGLNTAVAAALSEMAVAAVRKREIAVFAEFPASGHDLYDTIVQTITRGDIERANDGFLVGLWSETGQSISMKPVDVKEHLCFHTYSALVEFAEDYQHNRNGRPTKRMQKELASWDPYLNLQAATKAERLAWRRVYTINWLYDLVNVFASIVIQRNMKGENHAYENVDWSPQGPWHEHRRIFGLAEFAGFATSLAMQKRGTNIRSRIQPHHVFNLQVIVDSWTISRGWTVSVLTDEAVTEPAPNFRARRDVDIFLDRDNQRDIPGYLLGVDLATQVFSKRPESKMALVAMEWATQYLVDWLGESKYMTGLDGLPPSRFSSTDSNGLNEYSPYLNGAGLAEALSITSKCGLALWDSVPEVVQLVHIHNMLVQRGYIKTPVGLFDTLQNLYPEAFYKDKTPPKDHFLQALLERRQPGSTSDVRRQFFPHPGRAIPSSITIETVCDAQLNEHFNRNSILVELIKANWSVDRISNTYLTEPRQALTWVHLITQGTEAEQRQHAEALNLDWSTAVSLKSALTRGQGVTIDPSHCLPRTIEREGYTDITPRHQGEHGKRELTAKVLLQCAKVDIQNEVCGIFPLLAINHAAAALSMVMLFCRIGDALHGEKTTARVGAYPTAEAVALGVEVLASDDSTLLRTVAAEFETNRLGFMPHAYWDDVVDIGDATHPRIRRRNPKLPEDKSTLEETCVIM